MDCKEYYQAIKKQYNFKEKLSVTKVMNVFIINGQEFNEHCKYCAMTKYIINNVNKEV